MRLLGLAVLLTAALGGSGAHAQVYPSHPIKFVVPYPAGGAADILARVVGQKLSEQLGQPVVIDNRPGAGTAIGSDLVAKAPPDGYTILMGTVSSHAINPALNTNVGYDPVKDFAPIAPVASLPFILDVHPAVPARSVAELIALAKAQPGKLNFASAGNGTSNHLAGELFKSMAGIDIVHVPYRGSAPALSDVIAGQVTMMFDLTITSLPQIEARQVRALAITTPKRSALAPDLPTVAESGLPGYAVDAWFGVFAPAGTPPPVVKRLNTETVAALKLPDVRERLASQGAEPLTGTSEEFAAYVRSEAAKWAKLVHDSGMTVN
ncbi:MAG TPA: tripartite tricarboxylate transporter substrate binding protein [Alphaproteobacteria bacterium]